MQKPVILLIIAALNFLGCSTSEKRAEILPTLGKSHFKNKTNVIEKDTYFILNTTDGGGIQKRGIKGQVLKDNFLRVLLMKGETTSEYQIFNVISYKYIKGKNGIVEFGRPQEEKWKNFNSVTYQSIKYDESKELLNVVREIRCGNFHLAPVAECLKFEKVVFPVEEKLLRYLAAKYASEPDGFWSYRITSQSGKDTVRMRLSFAEIAGFLEKVDEYRFRQFFKSKPRRASVSTSFAAN